MVDKNIDPKEERRQEILEAALRAFGEKGYDKTSVNDIVKASGLSKGTLYWYFENKQAIFIALVRRVFDDMWGVFGKVMTEISDLPPPERMRRMFESMHLMVDEISQYSGLYSDFFTQAWQQQPIREVLLEAYQHYITDFEAVIEEGIRDGYFRQVDARLVATTIAGALDGYWFQQLLGAGKADETVELFGDLMIRGLMRGDKL